MNAQTFLNVDLVLHITGFTMLAGTMLAEIAISRRMNRYILIDKMKAVTVMDGVGVLSRFFRIGGALLVITGFAMVSIFREAVTSMLWFRIKMLVVVLIIVIGAGTLRRNNNRLRHLLEAGDDGNDGRILAVQQRLGVFYGIELFLLLLIFVLSVFKF
jgi:uncharacterized membrane protein SirB2